MTPEQEKLLHQSLMGQFQAPPVSGSSFEVNTQGPNLQDTVKMAGNGMQNAPAAPPEPIQPPAPMPEPVQPPMAAAPRPAFNVAPPPKDPKIVSSQPGLTQDEIGTYLKQQRGQMDKYGPDQQKAVMDDIAKKYGGVSGIIGDKMAQASDDIMQGVARAGSGQAMARRQQAKQQAIENAMNENKSLDESNMKHVAADQSLDQMDPNSAIGKAMIGTYAPLLDKLGISKEKQAQMLPALISTMAPDMIKHTDAMARVSEANNRRDEMATFRQDNVDQQNWIKLGNNVNGLNAGSRKALGVAASANMRADRLLRTAQDPNATNQDIHNMISDIQGIYKGGVPDEISLKHGQYKTLLSELANMQTYLSSKPTAVRTPDVVTHLAKVTRELKEIDNKVISDNLGINAVVFEPLIAKDPERWGRLTGAVMGTTSDPVGDAGAGVSAGKPAGEVMRKTKDGKIAVFDGASKQFLRYQ